MAFKALLMKLFRVGGDERKDNQASSENAVTDGPARYHPYEEVSDEQLIENRRGARSHPYEEVSDEQLAENRQVSAQEPKRGKPVRLHQYDDVDLQPANSKVQGKSGHKPALNKGAETSKESLNYVEVDLSPSTCTGGAKNSERTIYSQIRLSDSQPDDGSRQGSH